MTESITVIDATTRNPQLVTRKVHPTTRNTITRWRSECLKKCRYDKRSLAYEVKARAEAERYRPLRVYWCPHCFGWHLTKRI